MHARATSCHPQGQTTSSHQQLQASALVRQLFFSLRQAEAAHRLRAVDRYYGTSLKQLKPDLHIFALQRPPLNRRPFCNIIVPTFFDRLTIGRSTHSKSLALTSNTISCITGRQTDSWRTLFR
ncbi:unnamed protein product [Periconia digitata]|uniref:Uncharacterized protein n=1 Tax=Periconia digitata TaxID=1303443 RepID=A0A9W4U5Z9_9PLEO|nr:unnamed protein product [Periconia digitata]